MGVRVYTIGIGSNGPVPIQTPLGYQKVILELDEKLLNEIATTTKGKYFKASTTEALIDVYKTIDKLEKSKVEVEVFRNYDERYAGFAWSGLAFLFFELLLGLTRFRRIP